MPFIHQQALTADFLVSEAHGQRSRENVILAVTAAVLPAGQLLSIGTDGTYVAYAGPGSDPEAPVSADGVLYGTAPISDDEQMVVIIARDAEVSAELLVGLDDAARDALAVRNIIVRD